jgi:4-hydroxy-tetrahydrodipicolinate synthase
VAAVKEAGGSVDRVSHIKRRCDIDILSGDDSLTFPMMAVGAVGVISVATNVAPRPVSDMVHYVLAGQWPEAAELHLKYHRLFCDLFLDTNPVPVKAAMAMMGLIEEVYRMPLCPMSDALKEKLSESLRELNIL